MATWTNKDRAKSAMRACEVFASSVGLNIDDGELRTAIGDLVTNLMHLVHEDGGDAHEMVQAASDRFQEEYEEEEFGEDE